MGALDQATALQEFEVLADGDGRGREPLRQFGDQGPSFALHDAEDLLAPFIGEPILNNWRRSHKDAFLPGVFFYYVCFRFSMKFTMKHLLFEIAAPKVRT